MRVVSKYEVMCPSCRVSYPPEQKRCIHCGGRTERSIVDIPDSSQEYAAAVGNVKYVPEPAGGGREMVFRPRDAGADEAESEPAGGMLRRLGGLVWILLFVILTVIRMCGEE